MKNTLEELKRHQSSTPSKWRERAEYRAANKSWLRYSQIIAVIMLEKMDKLGITQKELANKMNCSQQYISKILKGQENMSLETLSKIEQALQLEIINFKIAV